MNFPKPGTIPGDLSSDFPRQESVSVAPNVGVAGDWFHELTPGTPLFSLLVLGGVPHCEGALGGIPTVPLLPVSVVLCGDQAPFCSAFGGETEEAPQGMLEDEDDVGF